MEQDHIMLDIETVGTKPGCVVLSVGAALFVPQTGKIKSTFYEKIAFKDSVLRGLSVDPATWSWWEKQPEDARTEAFRGTRNLAEVALDFEQWVRSAKGVKDFWCQGTDFDYPIWEEAFRRASMAPFPVKYYSKRDTRTLYAVAGVDVSLISRDGTHHNALDDVLHQVRCVHECYRALNMSAHNEETEDFQMKLGELKTAIRHRKGNPEVLVDLGGTMLRVTVQKSSLLEALDERFPEGRVIETGLTIGHDGLLAEEGAPPVAEIISAPEADEIDEIDEIDEL